MPTTAAHQRSRSAAASSARRMNSNVQGSRRKSSDVAHGPTIVLRPPGSTSRWRWKAALSSSSVNTSAGWPKAMTLPVQAARRGRSRPATQERSWVATKSVLSSRAQVVEEVRGGRAGRSRPGRPAARPAGAGRLLGQRAGDEHPPLLAAGQLADQPLRQVGQPHPLQRRHRRLAVAPAGPAHQAQAAVAAHQHDVQRRSPGSSSPPAPTAACSRYAARCAGRAGAGRRCAPRRARAGAGRG